VLFAATMLHYEKLLQTEAELPPSTQREESLRES